MPANRALGDGDGLFQARLPLCVLNAIDIFLAVFEFEGIGRDLRQINLIKLAVIKHNRQALLDGNAQMMPAMRADIVVRRQIPVEQHPITGRALLPQIIGNLFLLPHDGAHLGTNKITKPIHVKILSCHPCVMQGSRCLFPRFLPSQE